jgi:polysaccharide biosynthesis protein PslH
MNILYLVPHVPNPTKARSHFQIRGLLEAGHNVTVVTLERSVRDTEYIDRLRQTGCEVVSAQLTNRQALQNSVSAIFHRLPLQARFLWSTTLKREIEQHLSEHSPDIIHVEHLRMAQYGLRLTSNWPVIWDAVDHLTSLYEQTSTRSPSALWRLIARYEAPQLKRYESRLIRHFPVTLVISPHDQRLFQLDNPYSERVRIAPLGLPLSNTDLRPERASSTLIITGALNYQPNVVSVRWFIREIFPLILCQRPDVKLQLVGANPGPTIRALSSPQIEVTGFVPSVLDYLRQSTIALAPIVYGSGTQIKVIEAFMSETPLIATSTALRGLTVTDKEHVLVADNAVEFANAIIQLLADSGLRDQIAASGRHYVEQYHDLTKTTEQLVHIYQAVKAMQARS